jgi:glycosyltransferase involved in cell wall biosynthesis
MTICFVSYWGINEGLTQATVIPHVKLLAGMPDVDQVLLVTIERKPGYAPYSFKDDAIKFFPVESSPNNFDKLKEHFKFDQLLRKLNNDWKLNLIIARGVLAASLCERMAGKLSVPYTVESFEPHADYMVEDGIWKKAGFKYWILKQSEKRQLKNALAIHTVTDRYRQSLIHHEEVDKRKISAVPCTADPDLFRFNDLDRQELRRRLGVSGNTVLGLYTGKFGGIYLDVEALSLFKSVKDLLGLKDIRFFLVVLSPDHEAWKSNLLKAGFLPEDFHIAFVNQQEVPAYCSAADFAFSLHRPKPSKIGISPIKNAEFLLSGLPVIIPKGIGDDSELFSDHNLGVALNDFRALNDREFHQLNELMNGDRLEGHIRKWALAHRTYHVVAEAYRAMLSSIG